MQVTQHLHVARQLTGKTNAADSHPILSALPGAVIATRKAWGSIVCQPMPIMEFTSLVKQRNTGLSPFSVDQGVTMKLVF